MKEYECAVCGAFFVPKRTDRTTTCSRECGLFFSGFVAAARKDSGRVSVSVFRSKCEECGASFSSKRRGVKICSDACRKARAQRMAREANEAKRVAPEVTCAECGVSFAPAYGTKRRVFCSDKCSQRSIRRKARKAERARLRAVKVEPVCPTKVFERDGWRCQLCGCKTPRRLRGTTNAKAPELDHIMPLSLGGEHSYRNTQCACRACNATKSNKPQGQLVLL